MVWRGYSYELGTNRLGILITAGVFDPKSGPYGSGPTVVKNLQGQCIGYGSNTSQRVARHRGVSGVHWKTCQCSLG